MKKMLLASAALLFTLAGAASASALMDTSGAKFTTGHTVPLQVADKDGKGGSDDGADHDSNDDNGGASGSDDDGDDDSSDDNSGTSGTSGCDSAQDKAEHAECAG
jgi:hypothetical protein